MDSVGEQISEELNKLARKPFFSHAPFLDYVEGHAPAMNSSCITLAQELIRGLTKKGIPAFPLKAYFGGATYQKDINGQAHYAVLAEKDGVSYFMDPHLRHRNPVNLNTLFASKQAVKMDALPISSALTVTPISEQNIEVVKSIPVSSGRNLNQQYRFHIEKTDFPHKGFIPNTLLEDKTALLQIFKSDGGTLSLVTTTSPQKKEDRVTFIREYGGKSFIHGTSNFDDHMAVIAEDLCMGPNEVMKWVHRAIDQQHILAGQRFGLTEKGK